MPITTDPKRAKRQLIEEREQAKAERLAKKRGRPRNADRLAQIEERRDFQLGQVESLREYYARIRKARGIDLERMTFPRFVRLYNEWKRWGTPRFHSEIREWLQATHDHERRILLAYRERGKRHLACLYGLWCLLIDPDDTIMVVRATAKIAKRNSIFFKRTIETFPLLSHLYPAKPDQWTQEEITINRLSRANLNPSLQITRLDRQFVGMHARLLIGDDVEVENNCKTRKQRQDLKDKASDFAALCDFHLYAGTPWAEDSLYWHLPKLTEYEIAKWPVWRDESNRIPQEDEIPIAGKLHRLKWIERRQREYRVARFRQQYMLENKDTGQARLNRNFLNWFHADIRVDAPHLHADDERFARSIIDQGFYQRHRNRVRYWIGPRENQIELAELQAYWDWGSAKHNRDRSVIRVVGRTHRDDVYVLEAYELPAIRAGTFDHEGNLIGVGRNRQQITKILDILQEYHLDTVAVESDPMKRLQRDLREEARRRNRRLQVREVFQGGRSGRSKQTRIEDALEPLMLRRTLYVRKKLGKDSGSHFLEELKGFPDHEYDDVLDRISGAIARLRFRYKKPGKETDPLRLRRPLQRIKANRYTPHSRTG